MRHIQGMFHGGQSGLRIGESLLPPNKTGAKNTIADGAVELGYTNWDRDHVYVTPVFAAALLYAAAHPSGGWIYLVEPVGELEHDPDCSEPGLSFRVPSARILRAFVPSKAERRKALRALVMA